MRINFITDEFDDAIHEKNMNTAWMSTPWAGRQAGVITAVAGWIERLAPVLNDVDGVRGVGSASFIPIAVPEGDTRTNAWHCPATAAIHRICTGNDFFNHDRLCHAVGDITITKDTIDAGDA